MHDGGDARGSAWPGIHRTDEASVFFWFSQVF